MKKFLVLMILSIVSFSALAARVQPVGCEYLYYDGLYKGAFDNNTRRYNEISSSHAMFFHAGKRYMKYALDNHFNKYGEICIKPIKMFYSVMAHPKFKENLQTSLIVQDEVLEARKELNEFKYKLPKSDMPLDAKLKRQKAFLEKEYKEKLKKFEALPSVEVYPEFNNMMTYLKAHKKEFDDITSKAFEEKYGNSKDVYEYTGCPYLYVRLLRDISLSNISWSLGYDNLKVTKLNEENRKEYLSDDICRTAFEKFDALYKNKYFLENLNQNKKQNYELKELNKEYYQIQDKLYDKKMATTKEEKEKLKARMKTLNLTRIDMANQEMGDRGISHFKEYKEFLKYLKDTKPIMEKMHSGWFDILPDEYIGSYEEDYVDSYDKNGNPIILKSITLF